MSDPLGWLEEERSAWTQAGRLRRLVVRQGSPAPRARLDGREYVHFGSNDYLGLASHPQVVEAACEAARREGWGAGASPLVIGHHREHQLLEEALARFEQTDAAVVFPSGYAANVGTITALVGRQDAVFSDQYNHASLIDGMRLSRAQVFVYRHGDVHHLETLLREHAGRFRRRLIATDGVFSMHGDLAPLPELVRLARQYDCMLLVDEAHGTGVLGPQGRGAAEHLGVHGEVPIHLGTLSKALGSQGGFVAGSQELVLHLVNRARSLVFSTAMPPASAAAARAALELVEKEPERRQKLLHLAGELRRQLQDQGWNVPPGVTPIVPVFVGTEQRVLELAGELRRRGLWVPAIRPPSVPEGQCCLRISLSAQHTPEQVHQLAQALAELRYAGESASAS